MARCYFVRLARRTDSDAAAKFAANASARARSAGAPPPAYLCVSAPLFARPLARPSVHLSVRPFVRPSVRLRVQAFVCCASVSAPRQLRKLKLKSSVKLAASRCRLNSQLRAKLDKADLRRRACRPAHKLPARLSAPGNDATCSRRRWREFVWCEIYLREL